MNLNRSDYCFVIRASLSGKSSQSLKLLGYMYSNLDINDKTSQSLFRKDSFQLVPITLPTFAL